MVSRQKLAFCTAPDGTRIAIASIGSGPPLVRAAHWLSHVEHDLASPVWRPWLTELSRQHTYVRYDQRGCGLSDHEVADFSLDAWVGDLEAVVASLGLRRFPLIGMSQGGAVAIAYAVRHPEQVSHLVLAGAYARGALRRATTEAERLESQTLINLVRVGWGRDNPAFRQVFTNLFIPDGTPEQHQWWNELERLTVSPENAARTLEAFYNLDVSALAGQVRVPTLVMHSRGDARVPFDEGRKLAAMIPGARFVPLESRNHVLLENEAAWPVFMAEVRDFLGAAPAAARCPGPGQRRHRPPVAEKREDRAQPGVEHLRQAGRAHARRGDRACARPRCATLTVWSDGAGAARVHAVAAALTCASAAPTATSKTCWRCAASSTTASSAS